MAVVIAVIVVDNDPPIIFSSKTLPYQKILQFRIVDLAHHINSERSKSRLNPILELDVISDSKTKIYEVSLMEMEYLTRPGLIAFDVSGREALGNTAEITPYMYVVHRSNERPALRDSPATGCFLFAGQRRKFIDADIEDNRIYVIPHNSSILMLGDYAEKFYHIFSTRRYLPPDELNHLELELPGAAQLFQSVSPPAFRFPSKEFRHYSNLLSFMNDEKAVLDGLPSSQGLESITSYVFFTPYGLDLAWAASQSPSTPNVQIHYGAIPWPHHLIVTVKPAADCFTYRPKPDFSVWSAGHLLRLSVEIESQPDKADYNRLLIEAASAVRMANIAAGRKQTFVNSIYVEKTWESVSWNFLFEREGGPVVCVQKFFNLSNPIEALHFVRNLYQARDLVLSETISGELINKINNMIKALRTVPKKGSFIKSFGGTTGGFNEELDGDGSGGGNDASGGAPGEGDGGAPDGGYDNTQDGGYGGASPGGHAGTPDAGYGGSPPRYSSLHSSTRKFSSALREYQQSSKRVKVHEGPGDITSLGQYQLHGAKTANVYLATTQNGSHVVAKKVTRSEGQIYRFLMDLKGSSDHILFPLDIVHVRSYDYYVFPRWVPLANVIALGTNGPNIPDDRFVSLCADLASALSYLHKNRIAHLDVKPENLVINHTHNPKLKLIDFNLAIQVRTKTEKVCHVRGTMGYVAPEVLSAQLTGESYLPFKADTYSCGQVFLKFANRMQGTHRELVENFGTRFSAMCPGSRPPPAGVCLRCI